jgi:stage III sporulation protein SpoIIIAA
MDGEDNEEFLHLKEMQKILRTRLRLNELQRAKFGQMNMPSHLVIDKEEIENQLGYVTERLQFGDRDSENISVSEASKSDIIMIDEEIDQMNIAPFIFGPPIIHPKSFFGREEIIKRIFQLVRKTPLHNSIIIGPRRSGKTSLMYYIQSIVKIPESQLRIDQHNEWLPRSDYRWLWVDFQDRRLGKLEKLLRYILNGLKLEVPEPCTLDRFIDKMSGINSPTVILLDEIGTALEKYPELNDDFWESLRYLCSGTKGNLGFILGSHTSPIEIAYDSGHSSPFFNIFGYRANLGPFTEKEARSLVDSSPISFLESDIEWILTTSRRWPILLQICCYERLTKLESGQKDESWKDSALEQIQPFKHLLEYK